MRMRKLGHGQSLIFFAPDEVDRDIRRTAQKRSDDSISTLDIVRWAILEICCSQIQHFAPHSTRFRSRASKECLGPGYLEGWRWKPTDSQVALDAA